MKERPILFNTQMVKAILEGRKTQTRRIINPQPTFKENTGFHWKGYMYGIGSDYAETMHNFTNRNCPFGRVGDQLWVRETFAIVPETAYRHSEVNKLNHPNDQELSIIYKQGFHLSKSGFSWKPSIHMPRWASRILLEITNVRVERLTDISVKDALSEGIEHKSMNCPRHEFFQLWNSVYGDMAHEQNNWVWVVEFKQV
ncbi:hypothetical protein DJ533_00405 (plasmid) [Acinetobacter defluvii]|uniref:Morphogenetic protein n=1 Tax=Acinetobacter defluvii TaxID=1871111 RepID=A0A2S2F8A5_9GAMM|nr:hypothetical protein [Acinetobacter defluvii]AWL27179.1 hypothetical protein DJ533_00405 [Acinetobacter defluvii]